MPSKACYRFFRSCASDQIPVRVQGNCSYAWSTTLSAISFHCSPSCRCTPAGLAFALEGPLSPYSSIVSPDLLRVGPVFPISSTITPWHCRPLGPSWAVRLRLPFWPKCNYCPSYVTVSRESVAAIKKGKSAPIASQQD